MPRQGRRQDFAIATGAQRSVRELVEFAAEEIGIRIAWKGKGLDQNADNEQGHQIVAVEPRYFRPSNVETLLGDASKARKALGGQPKTSFRELLARMVREDLKSAKRDELVRRQGHATFNYYE